MPLLPTGDLTAPELLPVLQALAMHHTAVNCLNLPAGVSSTGTAHPLLAASPHNSNTTSLCCCKCHRLLLQWRSTPAFPLCASSILHFHRHSTHTLVILPVVPRHNDNCRFSFPTRLSGGTPPCRFFLRITGAHTGISPLLLMVLAALLHYCKCQQCLLSLPLHAPVVSPGSHQSPPFC